MRAAAAAATGAGADGGRDDLSNGGGDVDCGTTSICRTDNRDMTISGNKCEETKTYNKVVGTWVVNEDVLEGVVVAVAERAPDVEATWEADPVLEATTEDCAAGLDDWDALALEGVSDAAGLATVVATLLVAGWVDSEVTGKGVDESSVLERVGRDWGEERKVPWLVVSACDVEEPGDMLGVVELEDMTELGQGSRKEKRKQRNGNEKGQGEGKVACATGGATMRGT